MIHLERIEGVTQITTGLSNGVLRSIMVGQWRARGAWQQVNVLGQYGTNGDGRWPKLVMFGVFLKISKVKVPLWMISAVNVGKLLVVYWGVWWGCMSSRDKRVEGKGSGDSRNLSRPRVPPPATKRTLDCRVLQGGVNIETVQKTVNNNVGLGWGFDNKSIWIDL